MGRSCDQHKLMLRLAAAGLVLLALPASAAAARPDLKITKLTAGPAQAHATLPILVVDTTTNVGRGKAKRSENGYFLSRDEKVDEDDQRLGGRSVKKLKRRKRADGSLELTIPAGASGNYRLIACADDPGRIKEKSERNNCRASGPITVAPADDDNQAPFANLDYSPAVPETGEQVQFTSSSTDPDGTIVSARLGPRRRRRVRRRHRARRPPARTRPRARAPWACGRPTTRAPPTSTSAS